MPPMGNQTHKAYESQSLNDRCGSEAAASLRVSYLAAWGSANGQKRTCGRQEKPGVRPSFNLKK